MIIKNQIQESKLFSEFKGLKEAVKFGLVDSEFKIKKVDENLLSKKAIRGTPASCGTYYWLVFEDGSVEKVYYYLLEGVLQSKKKLSFILKEDGDFNHDTLCHDYVWTLYKSSEEVIAKASKEAVKEVMEMLNTQV